MSLAVATSPAESAAPAVRWTWLWSRRDDLLWNLLPFWLGLAAACFLYLARDLGGPWGFTVAGTRVQLGAALLYLYGPLVDAPHLWATIARTYTDRDEWTARRALFLGSLGWLLVGPAIVLLPVLLHRFLGLPAAAQEWGWAAFTYFLMFYALFHINKQHWGFVALYKRKNGDAEDAGERRVDSWFFQAAMWLPTAAMLVAPWYVDFDGKPFSLLQAPAWGSTLGGAMFVAIHASFWAICAAYAAYQLRRWRSGAPRNGPKLVYMATVAALYYATFSLHPLVAVFWVPLIGVGHCAQYHRVVWAYGRTRYAEGKRAARLPTAIFGSLWLYAALGVVYGLVTLQGPGAGPFRRVVSSALGNELFPHLFGLLGAGAGIALALKVLAAMISGVRLHHFYVDSKIWRVSRNAGLARDLKV